jgi:glutaredoxin
MSARFGAMIPRPRITSLLLAGALLASVAPALALYKVIGPDGSVTYTDRPPVGTTARVSTLGASGAPAPDSEAALPFELRQAASRFPVTLYTSDNCSPCDSARQFLQQRGVPFAERRITSEDDAAALERAVGGRTVPALSVGSQALRGLQQSDWAAYLDAAGYPRESRLPRNYQAPAPQPLVERTVPVTRAPAAPAAVPVAPAPAPEPTEASPAIRF